MRKLKAPFLAVTIILFNVSVVLAAPEPPEPTASTAKSAACEFCEGGTVPVPIDQNIVFLAISGLVLGTAVIYKNRIKKASI